MSVTTETQLANIALSLLGEGEIADLDGSGSTATKLAEVYDQNRDFVMEAFPWPCLIKRFHLVLAGLDAVEGISQASPGVVDLTGHAFTDGQLVTFKDIVGMTELNGGIFKVSGADTDDIELEDPDGDDVDTSGYSAWVSGGSIYLYATGVWEFVYDLPSDALKPLAILDVNFTGNTAYTWLREGSIIYASVEDAALKYIKKETAPANYTSDLVDAIAYRLAWLTCVGITGSTEMRAWLERRYDFIIKKMRGDSAEGGESQDRGEALWINAR